MLILYKVFFIGNTGSGSSRVVGKLHYDCVCFLYNEIKPCPWKVYFGPIISKSMNDKLNHLQV